MRLLLTSGGVTNPTIEASLVELLGKPIAECTALCVPTAQWGHPASGPTSVRAGIVGGPSWALTGLGWKSVGVLELTALPSIGRDRWLPWVRDADALLVNGGDATYLSHWLRESGLVDVLPSLHETVWVGVSAGSMALTPRVGDLFVEWAEAPDDHALGIVGFSIFPHLDYQGWPDSTLATARRWASEIAVPAYAIDDQTAITVVDDFVGIVSEGHWERFLPASRPAR